MQIHDKNQLDHDELIHLIALSMLPSLGALRLKEVINRWTSCSRAFEEIFRNKAFQKAIFEEKSRHSASHYLKMAENEMAFTQGQGIKLVTMWDEAYPHRLAECPDAPVLLYIKGESPKNNNHVLAVVGTRKATDLGYGACRELIRGLADLDVCIVSGMARGIDTCAHETALEVGLTTLAILGNGLNRTYPTSNTQLSMEILEKGALITEFPTSSVYNKGNFPSRNRIIAGLADAVVVVESAEKGGSLITADIANSYNREVFAIPGRPDDMLSRGCNNLIKSDRAALIDHAEDLLRWMSWAPSKQRTPVQTSLFEDLDENEKKIVESLSRKGELHIEQMLDDISLIISELSAILLDLELRGILESRAGKMYRLKGGINR